MTRPISKTDLEAYLDEALPAERMAEIEETLRKQPELAEQLSQINGRRDAGVHTIGEIWRRHRLTCPSRETLGSYLLQVLDDEEAAYIQFHLDTVGCRVCQANLQDLASQQDAKSEDAAPRRQKYFQSSVGRLKKE
ncbi:hypothetical protein LOC68_14865 [Blastopirellula sp. JC732]|uniref:Zinc-finger domain-containing protein n=1 Tax=Blastopirellula sediminis TaxID=2894196 RepID=A0A9X1MNT8_9BACT|nr:hypothetical protein [Blastopirellula sediminis]MCC9607035.1 hypothetical protein [Blastopirellula sediminis]MCC9629672.1 hypothetical protein [Blastopirellula sediminis]